MRRIIWMVAADEYFGEHLFHDDAEVGDSAFEGIEGEKKMRREW